MPLTKNVSSNIKELYQDNKLTGKAKGANGKPRGRNQIIAIALSAAKKNSSGVKPLRPKVSKSMKVKMGMTAANNLK